MTTETPTQQAQELNNDVSVIIMPLGLMFLFNILAEWGISNGGNPYIIGVFLMYFSWIIVYFSFVYPKFRREKHDN